MTELIVTNLNRRFTGVSATAARLIPLQTARYDLAVAGHALPGGPVPISLRVARRRMSAGRPFVIWHVRRNIEMRAALWTRDVLRRPIRIVFTTAGIRRHSAVPRWLMSRMDALIATTPAAAQGKPHLRAIVPHGVDCELWHPAADRPAAWAATGYPGRRGIACVGRIRPAKGTDQFVDAMLAVLPKHPDVTALIIGQARPSDAHFLDGLRAKIRTAGLADRVVFTGEIAPDEMPALIRACSLIVPLPRVENYGMTPLEGMASGVPFVGSDAGAFRTFAANGAAGIIVDGPDLTAAASAQVNALLADPDRLGAMSRHARNLATDRHSIRAEADGIAEVYEALWAEGSARDLSAS
ncbi:MAG: glycosyltransferase family 4 protein [Pseudomonadota bacterium]